MNIRQLRKTVADKGPLEFERLHCLLLLSNFFLEYLKQSKFSENHFLSGTALMSPEALCLVLL